MSRFRSWCFTINNPNVKDIEHLYKLKPKCKRAAFQLEKGEEYGTEHVQGVIQLKHGITFSSLKKKLPRAHLEICRDLQASFKYCTKEEGRIDEPIIWGDLSITPGTRTDLKTAALMDIKDIIEFMPEIYIKYHKGLEKLALHRAKKIIKNVEVFVFWGDPGVGKTSKVYELEPEVYCCPTGDKLWFDGYMNEEAILFDDFYGGIKYGDMLRYLDRYPLIIPTKGGHAVKNWGKVYITSNIHPNNWYPSVSDKRALMRRITKITHCTQVAGNTMAATIIDEEFSDDDI